MKKTRIAALTFQTVRWTRLSVDLKEKKTLHHAPWVHSSDKDGSERLSSLSKRAESGEHTSAELK